MDQGVLIHAEIGLKVLGYVRVSTKGQADSGLSLAVQRARVADFAKSRGMDLLGIVEDGGRSGESLRRKGIREIFARLDAADAVGVVVAKLDRLTRSVRDWSGLVEDRFGPDGVGQRLFSASESIDLTTPGGRMFANFLTAFAECELDTGVVRSGSVMESKRAKGEQLGNLPYGKMLGPDGRTLVDHPGETEVLCLIEHLRRAGFTFRAMATELDFRKITTRNGKAWSHSTVAKILARVNASQDDQAASLRETE